jgi:LacI family transcriptional regulator
MFCVDWTGAFAAMRALREARLSIPHDISLITYGGEEDWTAFLNPPLTTVEIDIADFAAKAMDQVESALDANPPSARGSCRIVPFLVVRESTAQLRRSTRASTKVRR